MDFTVYLVLGGILALFVLPWIAARRERARLKGEKEKVESQLRTLTARVFLLERDVLGIRNERDAQAARETARAMAEAGRETAKGPVAARSSPPQASVSSEATPSLPLTKPFPRTVSTEAPSVKAPSSLNPDFDFESKSASPQQQSSAEQNAPVRRPAIAAGTGQAGTQGPATFTRPSAPGKPALHFTDRVKSSLDVEEKLGTNWLNKLGIVILVLGVAFFLAYQLKELGPASKVLVGFLTGVVLLGAGIWAERHRRYQMLARAGMGGGWGLLFFTTYAMYNVPAAQVLNSQGLDLLFMMLVASAMVAHTLRYKSQAVTGLAFLLAFLTVTINHSNVYSLAAGAVLAAGLVVIVRRTQWFELELFGIAASYLNHYLWLRPIIEAMRGRHVLFPEFAASTGILATYWLAFRASYVWRHPANERQERVSTAAAVVNTVLVMAMLKYQSIHPEWAFWGLLALGVAETLIGQLVVSKRRRAAVTVLTTMGLTLLIAAFPFRYSNGRLSVLWLLEAEALLMIGVWTKDIIFRRFGILASVAVSIQMISVEAARVFGRRMDDADLSTDLRLAAVFGVAAAVFYLSAHYVLRRWPELFKNEFDGRVMRGLSYAAMTMAVISAWIAAPEAWTVAAWGASALGIAIAARKIRSRDLTYEAVFVAAASAIRTLSMNFQATHRIHGITERLITVCLVAILLYLSTRWIWSDVEWRVGTGKRVVAAQKVLSGSYTWTAALLLTLLAWYELRPVGVADAWMIGGLIWLEIGLTQNKTSLRWQGYTVFAACFLRIFFVNLNADGNPGEISPRFYTVLPLAFAFFYEYWRLHQIENTTAGASKAATSGSRGAIERRIHVGELCCWLGTVTVASLMRFELPADWVAAGWAATVFVLLGVAWRSKRRIFLNQGMLVAVGVLFRASLHNLYERSYFPPPAMEKPWITAGVAAAMLLASLPFAFKLREKNERGSAERTGAGLQVVLRHPEQVIFFIAIGLLSALLANEMRHGMVTLAWGIEGVAIFLLALKVNERSFRLAGLGLLLLCVAKIVAVDVWRLDPRDRYLTFIVLGAALLLVSFLYTRNREAIRQYL